jgi:hypothetical protein
MLWSFKPLAATGGDIYIAPGKNYNNEEYSPHQMNAGGKHLYGNLAKYLRLGSRLGNRLPHNILVVHIDLHCMIRTIVEEDCVAQAFML